ncbi:Protein of unknown function [Treponema bryantii]|uniref:DUF1266 domain-containing protein n=1 Tax=Treponema bryantii TaxID=163 RepID=A0A1I3KBH8_9SPIR|nr:YbeU/YbeR family protein [Treponema bryantii]SFI69842.1 Protein of unknown function [Treponema bryantii]
MKKLFFLLSFCFICFFVTAEQPFFLKHWIIPETIEWGEQNQIPEIQGKNFTQIITEENGLNELKVGPTEISNVDIPPYLSENKLFNWDMTYSQILSAFEKCNDFKTFEYLGEISSDYFSPIKVHYEIMAVAGKYQLEIVFPDYVNDDQRDSSKPVSFQINYNKDGKGFVPKEFFENEHRSEWNALSEDEKKIVAITCNELTGFGDYNFSCTRPIGEGANAEEVLSKDYNINSKDELLTCLDNSHQKKLVYEYKNFLELLNSDLEKNPVEIGLKHNLSRPEISKLFLVKDMSERLGENGISVLEEIYKLILLRLGIGAGYLTYEESMNIAVPIADRVLGSYASYEDFYSHYIAGRMYDNICYNIHVLIAGADLVIYGITDYRIPVDEIKFIGKTQDALQIEYSFYNPAEDSMDIIWLKTFKIEDRKVDVEEGLEIINSYINTFNDRTLVEGLYQKIRPVQPDYTIIDNIINTQQEPYASVNMKKYFEDNYKKYWDKLDDFEKHAIAFSSNIFQTNHMFHLDFCNRIRFENWSSGKAILKNDWDVIDYESLIKAFNELEEGGHNGSYMELLELLEKYPDKTPIEIGKLEELSVLSVTRLFFVDAKKDVLGKNGIRAWDDGREIALLRWGIGAGFISEEEAKVLMTPVVKRIQESYVSWDDYIYHYIAGRGFFGLSDSSYSSRVDLARYFMKCSKAFICVDDLKFYGKKSNKEIMSYGDCAYYPTKEAKEWEKLQNIYNQDETEETFEKLIEYENNHPEAKSFVFIWHIRMLCKYRIQNYDELISYIEESFDLIDAVDHESNFYFEVQIVYLMALGYSGQSEKFFEYYQSLPEDIRYKINNYKN